MVEVMLMESGKLADAENFACLRRTSAIKIILIVIGLLSVQLSTAQQRTLIAGLENHAEYRALVSQEAAALRSADSLSGPMASLRARLRTDTLDRDAVAADIVRMESEIFEIRSRMASLASQINNIEQEWILAGLSSMPAENPERDDDRARRLSGSGLEAELSAEQSAELERANRTEPNIPPLVARYRENHDAMKALAAWYDRATTQPIADSIKGLFDERQRTSDDLAEQISREWTTIFDSKSYIYNLLADKENRRDLLTRFEQAMDDMREEISRLQSTGAPAALLEYAVQKRMMIDYELARERTWGNDRAADSLERVLVTLPGPASLDGLEPVVLRERLFLDFSDITVGGSPYNASNPIPEVAVWPRGVIWRVLLGNFTSRQGPAVFRAAHPVAVQRGDDGRFRYFAGGFAADSLARAAVERMRRAGFRSPSAVVWMDGVYIDPAASEGDRIYRIEISGIRELSPEIRETVAHVSAATSTPAGDIVRVGDTYIISPLDAAAAIGLRTALETVKTSLPEAEVKLVKISE